MCTYSQLKKIQNNFVHPPQGVNGAPYVPNCTSLAEKISQNVLQVEA